MSGAACRVPVTDHVVEHRISYLISFLLLFLIFFIVFFIKFDQVLDVMLQSISSPRREAASPVLPPQLHSKFLQLHSKFLQLHSKSSSYRHRLYSFSSGRVVCRSLSGQFEVLSAAPPSGKDYGASCRFL
jgi:hypothetical protein